MLEELYYSEWVKPNVREGAFDVSMGPCDGVGIYDLFRLFLLD